jgi:hypothetical protein
MLPSKSIPLCAATCMTLGLPEQGVSTRKGTVDNFVAAKASDFNRAQQASTRGPYLLET